MEGCDEESLMDDNGASLSGDDGEDVEGSSSVEDIDIGGESRVGGCCCRTFCTELGSDMESDLRR